jgi:hypothetical protein
VNNGELRDERNNNGLNGDLLSVFRSGCLASCCWVDVVSRVAHSYICRSGESWTLCLSMRYVRGRARDSLGGLRANLRLPLKEPLKTEKEDCVTWERAVAI